MQLATCSAQQVDPSLMHTYTSGCFRHFQVVRGARVEEPDSVRPAAAVMELAAVAEMREVARDGWMGLARTTLVNWRSAS